MALPMYGGPQQSIDGFLPASSFAPSFPQPGAADQLQFYGGGASAGSFPPPSEEMSAKLSPLPPGPIDFDNEPPLLEELDIHPAEIAKKTLAIFLPFARLTPQQEQDTDLAGPFLFCTALAVLLLMQGKLAIGYVYGYAFGGCFLLHVILVLMAAESPSYDRTASIMGYCLVPIVVLGFLGVPFGLTSFVGKCVSVLFVLWATAAATRLIEAALNMRNQRWLVAYPVALLYSAFALLTIF